MSVMAWFRRNEPIINLTPPRYGLHRPHFMPGKQAHPRPKCDLGHWRCHTCYCCPCAPERCRPGCRNQDCACPDVEYLPEET